MALPLSFLGKDARILDMIRRGDEQGLALLFEETRRQVVGYVLAHHGSQEDAEDMLQDALIILWERVRSGRYEYTSRLATFLLGIVKNRWLRVLAGRRREPLAPADADPPDDAEPADEAIVEEERVAVVRRAMEQLDDVCRKVLLMFYWEERSMEDIAKALGFSNAATAKSKKYQCKKALERLMRSFQESEQS